MPPRRPPLESASPESASENIDLSFVLLNELAYILSCEVPERYYALGDLEDMLFPYWEEDAEYRAWQKTFLKRSTHERLSRNGCREWLRELRKVMRNHDFDGESDVRL